MEIYFSFRNVCSVVCIDGSEKNHIECYGLACILILKTDGM